VQELVVLANHEEPSARLQFNNIVYTHRAKGGSYGCIIETAGIGLGYAALAL
jgi:hypothetical protein